MAHRHHRHHDRFHPRSATRSRVEPLLPRRLSGSYDAAATTPDNRQHWVYADSLDALAAGSPEVRRVLRNRTRYEVMNNCYAAGICLTLAESLVGIGPRLQMTGWSAARNREVEDAWEAWAKEINLAAKLRALRMARAVDGEAFAMFVTRPTGRVRLDLRLIEGDQVASPLTLRYDPAAVDGLEYGPDGLPSGYYVLRHHPGAAGFYGSYDEADLVPSRYMIHWFRATRPGQARGIPELAPALPLFAQLRRYTLAELGAAENAASISLVMKTTLVDGAAAKVPYMEEMELPRGTAIFPPEGWEPYQPKAEHPVTSYQDFKREVLSEIARVLCMPYLVAALTSRDINYAGGRLDMQAWYRAIAVEQTDMAIVVLDRIFVEWLREMQMTTEALDIKHQWFWRGLEHVDPAKESTAQDRHLRNYSTTLAAEYAARGLDWETELRQAKRERDRLRKYRLIPAENLAPAPVDDGDADEEDDGDTGEEDTSARRARVRIAQ